MMRVTMRLPAIAIFAFWAVGCSDGNARFIVRESVEQLSVTHAEPGATLEVLDGSGKAIQSATADKLGSALFRHVPPGDGYVVRAGMLERSRHLKVLSIDGSLPSQRFYDHQDLQPGFNYIATRDGTRLSAYVTLPGPIELGPYPTVVTYSGYSPSKPGEPLGNYEYLCDKLPVLCDAPNDPGATIAALFGYATVGVNVRGTGCSGGAYDFFETLQLLDGYDVIETAAAQPWVQDHKVGMVGLSYPGITQMFVAAERPPSLAAITPLSVIGNAHTTMLPGGMLNDGFAIAWVTQVINTAQPYGQGWEQARVDGGDTLCAENQLLHGQLVDNVAQARTTQYYDPAQHDRYNPATFVGKIDVPVFLAGAWQDEQTGPYFFPLLSKFTSSPSRRFTIYNGVHPDGFSPDVLSEWAAFLDLFVAHRVPMIDPLVYDLTPLLMDRVFHSLMHVEPTKWSKYGDFASALADWKAEPEVRAIFESGAGLTSDLGAPRGTFEQHWTSWPPPAVEPMRLYFRASGALSATTPTESAAASQFQLDPEAGQRGNLAPGGNVWDKLPAYDWRAPAAGKAVGFESTPLAADLMMAGNGSVDLWLQSPVDDADLEVNLIEVRPDGKEMYVQSGWLRASYRGSGPDATELWPSPTYMQADWKALVPGEWTQVRVGFAGFHHVFRAGSRIRVFVNTPGGSRAEWRFALKHFDTAPSYSIGHDSAHPSSVVLPVVRGATIPSPLPPCSLRGQPCRDYAPYANTPAN
ncbi:MAG: Cocaine esterase [Myxococcales bacterium]|nr:Cocaine esterase [Myxococcales bacterium]